MPENTSPVIPRLHREFFDMVCHIEELLGRHANLSEKIFRPILSAAIERYSVEGKKPFREYLLCILQENPIIYDSIPDSVISEIFENDKLKKH